jgi:ribonuclease inhibitor
MEVWLILEIDGAEILTIEEFHDKLSACPAVPAFYGKNLDALWDTLTGLIEKPFRIVWRNASVSRRNLPDDFDLLVTVLEEAAVRDRKAGRVECFEYELID